MLLVPTISREFDVAFSSAQWMLTINLLVGAVATPVMGRLSDGPHKRRLLLVALAVIFAGSVAAALAPNFAVFLVGRAMQGLTYGIAPVTIAIARRYLSESRAKPAISSLSVTVATGIGVGYPLTGILASVLGFRAAFWFSAIFVVSAAAVVWRVLPSGADLRAPRVRFDYVGAVLLGAGTSTFLLVVAESAAWGWTTPKALACIVTAVVALSAWVRYELRVENPLINVRVLSNGDVLLANSAAVGLGIALYIGVSIASLIAQSPVSTGYGVELPLFWAGFVMLPLSVGSFGANRIVRIAAKRITIAALLPLGAAVLTASVCMLWLDHDDLGLILVGMFMFGVGTGMTYAAMPGLIARNVVVAELGSAVSFNQVLRTMGGAFGAAVAGAVLAAHRAADLHPTDAGIAQALLTGFVCSTVVFVALTANHVRRRRVSAVGAE